VNTLGRKFRVTIFGESHGLCVGVVADGVPAGVRVSEADIQQELDRRRGGQSGITTQRKEEDKVQILSGIFKGRTTGAPIAMLVWNKDVQSAPYEKVKNTPRPGHADYTAWVRFGGFNDYRGGGMLSGRLTAAWVMAGALAKRILAKEKISVIAHTTRIGEIRCKCEGCGTACIRANAEKNPVRCCNAASAEEMIAEIEAAKADGDSVGGTVECIIEGVPAGVGDPLAGKLDADLAKAMLTIPAVKGVLFGTPKIRGSTTNDEFIVKGGKILTRTNNAGGVLGGISTGMPVTLSVEIKPTSSIAREQNTVNLATMKPAKIKIEGRHDPCIVPRAVPVVEAMAAIVVLDHAMRSGVVPSVIR